MYQKSRLHMEEKLKRKLPLLNKNEEWLKYYQSVSDEDVLSSVALIEKLIKSEDEAKKQLSHVISEKKSAMRNIISLSHSINTNQNYSDIGRLDHQKIRIEKLNYELDNIQYELEMLPKKIQEANVKLLEATVDYSYRELNRRESELNEINREMIELRDRMRLLYEQRLNHEEWNEKIYVFLHSLLGPNVIEKIDDENRKECDEL